MDTKMNLDSFQNLVIYTAEGAITYYSGNTHDGTVGRSNSSNVLKAQKKVENRKALLCLFTHSTRNRKLKQETEAIFLHTAKS